MDVSVIHSLYGSSLYASNVSVNRVINVRAATEVFLDLNFPYYSQYSKVFAFLCSIAASFLSMEAFLGHRFTHLVVGGGTAGLVVAARLSENPDLTVGVLEAGPTAFDEPLINVPGRYGESLGSRYDWKFETVPQSNLNGRKLPWPRGKVLGGTSALNFMMWNRGNREDYDAWEELGNEGWGWDGLLFVICLCLPRIMDPPDRLIRHFFKKSENFHKPDAKHQAQNQSHFDAESHGTDGPLHIVHSLDYGAAHQYWHATLHKLGTQTNHSHSSGSNVGVWTSVAGVDPETRERSYSATAYYRPNRERPNLALLTEAIVREVILENEGAEWVAKGVKFVHGGEEHVVRAEGEVIVCAGCVQSPQLLELSGIGDPNILEAAGINVNVTNPNVGENLQDHMSECLNPLHVAVLTYSKVTAMIYEIDPSIATPADLRTDPILAEAADRTYATSQSGPRTVLPSSIAYLPFRHFILPSELSALTSPEFFQFGPNTTLRDRILSRRLQSEKALGQIEYIFDVTNFSPYFTPLPGKKYGTMLQILQYPFSKGSIHVPAMRDGKATTSDEPPVIDPKYYAGPGGQVDFRMMVAAQKFADKMCSTSPLSDIIVSRVFPAPSQDPDGKEGDFTDWVRDSTITDWHPVGTCAMGGKGAQDGFVVDGRLRVYGVRGLRVVDASIMPLQLSAHPQATVYAIGEKGASMILEDWKNRAV